MPRAKITWCDLQYLVDEETKSIKDKIKWPIIMMVGLGISIPIIIYLSSKASYSMRSSSKRFDEQALSLNLERRKTDGLLSQLLPADIISMLKTGFQILYNSCYYQGPLTIWTYHSFFRIYNQGPLLNFEYLQSGLRYQCASFTGWKFRILVINWLWF